MPWTSHAPQAHLLTRSSPRAATRPGGSHCRTSSPQRRPLVSLATSFATRQPPLANRTALRHGHRPFQYRRHRVRSCQAAGPLLPPPPPRHPTHRRRLLLSRAFPLSAAAHSSQPHPPHFCHHPHVLAMALHGRQSAARPSAGPLLRLSKRPSWRPIRQRKYLPPSQRFAGTHAT